MSSEASSEETLDQAREAYQAGRAAFERGSYRQSVDLLTQANDLVPYGSRLHGEIQIWLVTAYEAAGQRQEALELCRQVSRHPDLQTRKQSKRLLYILEAPRLKIRPEWLTEIPDLASLGDDNEGRNRLADRYPAPPPKRSDPKPVYASASIQPGESEGGDNRFIWLALAALLLVLGGFAWLS